MRPHMSVRPVESPVSRKCAVRRALATAALIAVTLVAAPAAHAIGPSLAPLPAQPSGVPFPTLEWEEATPAAPDVDVPRLTAALEAAFAEPDPGRLRRTRAVIVVRGGRIVAERYAQGFAAGTPLLGWSMTKSLTNAFCGILVGRGRLDVHVRADVPAWRDPADPRHAITLDQLLHASSGLRWSETYEASPFESDVIAMLFGAGHRDMPAYAAAKPLEHPPGTHWSYSSGTTLIVSDILRRAVGGTDADYHAFQRKALFERIGMKSAVVEPDAAGTFVGSSYSYATARDWARFGLFFLRDGTWDGARILPEGWVDYSRTPAPAAPAGEYGAHFWLNAGVPDRGIARPDARAPADLFFASGHEGQVVAIVPSRDLVIVRLGLTPGDGRYDLKGFVAEVIAAFAEVAR